MGVCMEKLGVKPGYTRDQQVGYSAAVCIYINTKTMECAVHEYNGVYSAEYNEVYST